MEKLFYKIQEYKNENDYLQVLETIYNTIHSDDYEAFYEMMLESERTNKKIYIDEESLKGILWSSLNLSKNVKMK